jgi:hypothetical protein
LVEYFLRRYDEKMSKWIFIIFLIGVLASVFYSAKKSAVSHKAKEFKVLALLRASSQWEDSARKDKDPILALLHSSASVAYLDAARTIMGDEDIDVLFDDIDGYVDQVEKLRDKCVRKMRAILERTLG